MVSPPPAEKKFLPSLIIKQAVPIVVTTTVRPTLHMGTRVGLMSGVFGMGSDLTMLNVLLSPNWAWRGGLLYASGNDINSVPRTHLAVSGDLIYRTAHPVPGGGFYVGGGGNYLLLSTGPRSGTWGGQVFAGGEYSFSAQRVFAEVGYGILRTGFSPSYRGMNFQIGLSSRL